MIAHSSVTEHLALAGIGILAVAAYGTVWARRSADRGIAGLIAWAAGTAAVLGAVAPPLESLADDSFTWHMAQHLVLGVVAPPLLLASRPGRLLLGGVPRLRRAARAALRPVASHAGPLVTAATAVALVAIAHVGVLYDLALRHRPVHDLQHIAFLTSGLLLWHSATSARARLGGPTRLIAALFAATGLALVSVSLLTTSAPLSEVYADQHGDAAALRDQRTGAVLMWVGMVALTLPLVLTAVWRWAEAEHRHVERAESLAAVAQQPQRETHGFLHHTLGRDPRD